MLSSGLSASLRACSARSAVASFPVRRDVSGGVYVSTRNDVKAGDFVERTEPFVLVDTLDGWGVEGDGCMGFGTIPAIMQSSWKTAVISTRSGGRFGAEDALRGRARTRATLIWSAQPMRSVDSSCQCRVHLKRSARGLSAGRSMNVIRVWEWVS